MRHYGDQVEINPSAVKTFYDKRFDPEHPLGSVMMSDDEEMLRLRDMNERADALPQFKLDASQTSVLDLGCGNGRWHDTLKESIWSYEGIDFSAPNIAYARQHRLGERVNFILGGCDQLGKLPLKHAPFDFVLSCGLFPYLNDSQLLGLLRALMPLFKPTAQVYFRTSVATIDQRLTLKDYPSEALKASYNAIYRTPLEYEQMFLPFLCTNGFSLINSRVLLNELTGARSETNQQYWLFSRSDGQGGLHE